MTSRISSWDQRRLAAACLNPGATMSRHAGIQQESPVGVYSPMRNCQGPCRRRRSHTQFTGTNTMCNQCVLRAPKIPDVMAEAPKEAPQNIREISR